MFSKIRSEWTMTVAVVIVTFLATTRQTNGQIYLLNYSEDRINSRLAEKTIDLLNVTDITVINPSSRIPSDLSQTTMDAITITWYVATFLALVAFFTLMACSDRKCGRRNVTQSLDDHLQQPPSPAPSYSEFAPPSYETVIEKHYPPSTTVFVVQVPYIENEKDKDPPPPFTFHTINELQKFSC